MSLEPPASIATGLAVAAVVYAIHSNMTPSTADIQSLPAGNKDVDSSQKKATWLSIGIVSGISLLAKDPTIFVIGSFAVIGMNLITHHANWTESKTGMLQLSPGQSTTANDMSDVEAMATEPYSTLTSQFVSS